MGASDTQAQLAALEVERARLLGQARVEAFVAAGVPEGLAAIVAPHPGTTVALGRALEWMSRGEPVANLDDTLDQVATVGLTVTCVEMGAVSVSGAWGAVLPFRAARTLGTTLIRLGHFAEGGRL